MKKLIILLFFFFATNAFAYTECEMKPNRVWLNLVGDTVWICFEGGGCIYKSLNITIKERHLNSMYSSAMAAIAADKSFIVRYPEDGLNCINARTSRSDVLGFWFKK